MVGVLSLLINDAVAKGEVEGFFLAWRAPILTHLMFADDVILFAKANPRNIYNLLNILNVYSINFGQCINVSKSGIIYGKFVQHALQRSVGQILNMQEWDNPSRYLGLQGEWGRSKISALTWVKERVLAKLEGWKEGLIN